MSVEWPLLGPPHAVDDFIRPMPWGSSNYTVIAAPPSLVEAAEALGTRRVAGELEGVEVNVALNRAPVFSGVFIWAGASLLRRLRLEVGDPVTGFLSPIDPDEVPVAGDLAEALADAGRRDVWDGLPPTVRRRHLVPIDSAATEKTRAKRVRALVEGL
ncbi:YdeI/OmpD-associated family protein [Marisediminicola sp. LYQ134]|uniref:YdeI/OmpD-associated family protein n=1 Tax=unclassified Marisediminicola TaxID=2618316 RepID=UPI0039839B42